MPELVGYPVLRTLSRGERAEVALAFDGEGPLAIKRLRESVPAVDVARELRALDRAQGDHVVRLLDAGTEGDSTCLVLEHLGGGDLTGVLRSRGSLAAGEVVTVLAPLATTVARLHAAGVAHGALAPGAVLFTGAGSPTLVGFGSAALFPPESPEVVLETIPEVAADRRALRELGRMLLARVEGAARGSAAGLAERLQDAAPDELSDVLVRGLCELAPPLPVRFDADDAQALATPSIAFGFGGHVSADDHEASDVEAGARTATPLPGWLTAVLEVDIVRAARDVVVARWGGWEPRRRRLVVGLGSAALVGVIALTAVPPSTPASVAPSETPPAVSEELVAGEVESADPSLSADDPVAAAVALLERRAECLRLASLLCLEGVVQSGSSAQDADRAAILAIQDGAEAPAPLTPGEASLVERLGDSALVSLGPTSAETEPASLLLMKSEAGWRVRDYLTPNP